MDSSSSVAPRCSLFRDKGASASMEMFRARHQDSLMVGSGSGRSLSRLLPKSIENASNMLRLALAQSEIHLFPHKNDLFPTHKHSIVTSSVGG